MGSLCPHPNSFSQFAWGSPQMTSKKGRMSFCSQGRNPWWMTTSPMCTCLMSVCSVLERKFIKMQVVGLACSKMAPLGQNLLSVTRVSIQGRSTQCIPELGTKVDVTNAQTCWTLKNLDRKAGCVLESLQHGVKIQQIQIHLQMKENEIQQDQSGMHRKNASKSR